MTVFTPRSQQSKEKTAKICDYFPFFDYATWQGSANSAALRPRSAVREVLFATRRAYTPSLTQCSTQTKIGGSVEPPIFFYFLANPREFSIFHNIINGLVLPCFEGPASTFFAFDHMFDHLRRFLHFFGYKIASFLNAYETPSSIHDFVWKREYSIRLG